MDNLQILVIGLVIAVLVFSFGILISKRKNDNEDDDLGYLENIVFEKGGYDE